MIDPKVPLEEQVAQLIREKEQLKVENRQLKRKIQYGLVQEDHSEQYKVFLHSEKYQQLDIVGTVTHEWFKPPKKKEVEGLPNNLVYLKKVKGHAIFLEQHFPIEVEKRGMNDE